MVQYGQKPMRLVPPQKSVCRHIQDVILADLATLWDGKLLYGFLVLKIGKVKVFYVRELQHECHDKQMVQENLRPTRDTFAAV